MTVVNESGLYNVILRSDKPEAKPFRKWVTSKVLPSIRKHGAYMTPQKIEEVLLNPDTIIKLATELKAEQEKRVALESKVEQDKPLVAFANSVSVAKTSILVGELAKLLKQNGVDMGQNRLFAWMRENGYLISRKGTDYKMMRFIAGRDSIRRLFRHLRTCRRYCRQDTRKPPAHFAI